MSDPSAKLDAPTLRQDDTLSDLAGCQHLPCHFAGYELHEEIARGGMGVVFRATQLRLNRMVAVKMIINGALATSEDIQRFRAEAESAANLDHPGIVPIYEVGEFNGRHFFSMAFVPGQSLAQRLTQGPLSAQDAASLVKEVAEAVHAAHEQGIIHRDLKPGNILLDTGGRPRITDFGVAKRQLADRGLTVEGALIGTPNYMPPEQARGELDQISAASDVYSLGAILYALLTGRPPFQSANQLDTLNQVINELVIPPRRLNSSVPLDLETITLKCLEKPSARRYQSAAELAAELRAFLAGEPIQARAPGSLRRAACWFRHNLLVASMSGLTSLALIAGLVGLAWYTRTLTMRAMYFQGRAAQLQSQVDLYSNKLTTSEMQSEKLQAVWQQANSDRLALLARQQLNHDQACALLLAAEACDVYLRAAQDPPKKSLAVATTVSLIEKNLPPPANLPSGGKELTDLARQLAGRELSDTECQEFNLQPSAENP